MWKSFNSKIFAVAIIPFCFYVIISIYVFVTSGFQLSVFNPAAVVALSIGTFLAAICYSFENKILHYLAALIMCILGGIGIYLGLSAKPIVWMELVTSALMIAFALGFLEFVEHRKDE